MTVKQNLQPPVKADIIRVYEEGLWGRITEAFGTGDVQAIADKLSLSYQAVYKWKQGKAPGQETLRQIAGLTGSSIHWLMTGWGTRHFSEVTFTGHPHDFIEDYVMHGLPQDLRDLIFSEIERSQSDIQQYLESIIRRGLEGKGVQLGEGEFAMYLGEEEHRIIQKLAGKSKRTFEDEVREQLIEHLEEQNLLTTQAGESNVVFFGDYVPNMISLPFFGEIAAGEPIMIFEREEMIDVPDFRRERNKQYMVLRARGDSMIDERIHDGSLIMCEVTNTAEKGDTIVAMIDNESATVKRYYPERGRIRLQPANPAHLPQFVTDDRLKIQGIVVGIFHKPS